MKNMNCCTANRNISSSEVNSWLTNFFETLPPSEINTLEDLAITICYQAGDLIFPEGLFADGMYIIGKGFIKYGRQAGSRDKKGTIFRLLGPGDGFGEEIFIEGSSDNRSASARAETEVELAFLEKNGLLDCLHSHPEGFKSIANWLTANITALQQRMFLNASESIEERIRLFLLDLALRHGTENGDDLFLPLPLKQNTLAKALGISVESVSTALNSLKEEGTIDIEQEGIRIDLPKSRTSEPPNINDG